MSKGNPEDSVIYKRIIDNIRYLRKYRNLTKQQLAKRSKVSQSYIGAIESGVSEASFNILEKIAAGLQVEPMALVELNLEKKIKQEIEAYSLAKKTEPSEEKTQPK